MLHVTNGSVFLSRLHDLGVPGQIVPWDDVLHEGPVPAGLTPLELRRRRAEFLAIDWGDVADIERGLRSRDQAVVDAAAGDEIVLWFEHDLYDQLHVLQVLDLLHGLNTAGTLTARVTADSRRRLPGGAARRSAERLVRIAFGGVRRTVCRRGRGLGRVPRSRSAGAEARSATPAPGRR